VNPWLITATVLLAAMAPCGVVCLRGDPIDRLVGLETAGTLASLILLVLAVGFGRAPFIDLGLAVALLSFGGGLVFARFLERWM
jgi:multicomponent Na+:H+ antiporter subunit F